MKGSKAAEKMRNMANEYDVITSELENALLAPSCCEDLNTPPFDESERGSTSDQKSFGYAELRNELSQIENKTYIWCIFFCKIFSKFQT